MPKNLLQTASWCLAASRWRRGPRQPLTIHSETGSSNLVQPRTLALLVVLAGLLVPASPALAATAPTITTPATTPSYTMNQVDLVWTQENDATSGYTVSRGTAADCSDAVPVFSTPLVTTTSYSETPPDGSYCYFVTSEDGVNPADSSIVRIFRDSTDPAGSWSSPTAGQPLTGTGTLDLTVAPSDATSGVNGVAFEIETAPGSGTYTSLGTDTTAPYQATWPYNLSTIEGTYNLRATIADRAGNTALLTRTVIDDNTGPTGDITVANAVRGTVSLPAVASDGPDGSGVKTMQWFRYSAATGSSQIGVGVLGGSGSVSWDTTAVPDGLYQLSLSFFDNANNASTSVHTPDVLVDNTLPSGTLAPASNGAVGASATLVASVSDAGSGLDQVTFSYSPNGLNSYTTLGVDSTGPTYQYVWDTTGVAEGSYDLRATVADAVGNSRVINSTAVTVDRTAPTAALSAPASGANVRGAVVAVTPAVSDSGSGIAHVVTEYAPNSTGIYSTVSDISAPGPYGATWDTTALGDGLYSVRTRVFDKAGNSASDTNTNVRIDNTAPSVTRTAPAANAILRGTAAFAGSASDAGSGLASDSFVLSQSGVDKATVPAIAGSGNAVSATLDTTLPATPDGLYDVRLEAHDSAGNTATTSLVTVRIDNTSPTGSLTTAPTAGSTVSGAVALASADAADGGSGVQSVSFEFAPTTTNAWSPVAAADTVAPYSVSWATSTLCDGTWDLRITVTDAAGNALSTAPITAITTANGNCTAAITAPADSTVQHDAITVSANATAASGDSVANVTFAYRAGTIGSWNTIGSPVTLLPYSVSFATTGVADGLCDLRATVSTVGGKSGQSAPVTIRVDNNAPAAPTGFAATAKTDGSVGLAWTAAVDAPGGSGVASYTVRRAAGSIAPTSPVDGDAACTAVTATSCNDANVLTGRTYTYAVFATDLAGKTSLAATATVTPRDSEAPAAPAGLAATPGDGLVALSWQAAAADSDVTSYVLVARAGRDVPVSENDGTRVCSTITAASVSCTATGLTNGLTYTFALFAFDEALNRSLPGTVSAAPNGTPPADTTPPSAVTGLAAKASGTTVTLSWKNPKDADFDHVIVSSSKAGSIYQGDEQSTTVEQPAGKLRSYKVIAYDKAGNASEAVTVKVTTDGGSSGGTKFDGPVSPAHGEKVLRKKVVLRWKKAKKASYYNIQIFDSHKQRVAIAWPHGTHWKVPSAKLKKGKKYTWYVWPGYGKLAKAKYGKRIGKATFKVK